MVLPEVTPGGVGSGNNRGIVPKVEACCVFEGTVSSGWNRMGRRKNSRRRSGRQGDWHGHIGPGRLF